MLLSRPRILIVVGLVVAVALLLVSSSPAVAAPRGSAQFETTREEILESRRYVARHFTVNAAALECSFTLC